MNEFFFDCYLEFQEKFKPVKFYSDKRVIIKEALKVLVGIITDPKKNRSEFLQDIKLVYPNYFTEEDNEQYKPIFDEIIFFNEKDLELKSRVLQHMSYYLTKGKFIRISNSLLENANLNVSSFYINKDTDVKSGKKTSDKFQVYINGVLDVSLQVSPLSIGSPSIPRYKYPTDIVPPTYKAEFLELSEENYNNKEFFKNKEFLNDKELFEYKNYIFVYDTSEIPAAIQPLPKDSKIKVASEFYEIFKDPLSAHFVMLKDASLLYVYSRTAQIGKDNSSLGYGGMFVLLRDDLSKERIKEYTHFFQLISDYISICIAHNIMRDNQLREATKSAKAAIMSRNMSHNLGSHVMSYLKQHLGTVKDMINDRILSNIINEEKDLTAALNKDVNSTALPFLLGLGHFISYLQERQDFIATIATDYIPYYSTINFKDDIYDVLNPDKRAKRHPERRKTSNVEMDNILLGNIARSEGLGRPTRPTCIFSEDDTKSNEMTENLGDIVLYFGECFDGDPVEEGSYESDDLENMRKINFSLPGGIVGRQAIFSILENVIRNAAKHGKWRNNGQLGLTFNIYRSNSDNIPSDDNDEGDLSLLEVFQNFYFNARDKDDLFFVTITDNCEIDHNKMAELRAALQDDYVDATGIMRDGYKGLKEMRISSSWIRSARNEDIFYSPWPKYNENDKEEKKQRVLNELKHDREWNELTSQMDQKAPLLYTRIHAIKIGGQVENRNLQYIFCVPIPKKVAIVSRETIDDAVKEKLVKNYWRYFSQVDFDKESNKSFEFILCDDFNNTTIYEEVRSEASSRVYPISKIAGFDRHSFFSDLRNMSLDNDNYKNMLESYEKILYKKLSSYNIGEKILIEDDRAKENIKHSDEEGMDQIIRGNVLLSGSPHPGEYIYRTHHEVYDLFEKYMQTDHSETVFVEGISGNNSTDRLIRNEIKDDIWFYRHLHAIKQQIAIFDERIYPRIGMKTDLDYSKDHIATTYIQKGVYVFTLVEEENAGSRSFGLYGCVLHNGSLKLGEKYSCLCNKLATLSYTNESGLSIKPIDEDGNYILNKFDYISIHQGLLDKMYKVFGIKGLKKDSNIEKTRISNQLYLLLGREGRMIAEQDNWEKVLRDGNVKPWKDGFVPGLIIHSGRSKPGINDMPQKLPFLQYAAIEHAVLDCKFSLVELLDYARYEK